MNLNVLLALDEGEVLWAECWHVFGVRMRCSFSPTVAGKIAWILSLRTTVAEGRGEDAAKKIIEYNGTSFEWKLD